MSRRLKREDLEYREITVKVALTMDPARSNNIAEFWPGKVDVLNDDDQEIGFVAAGFSANVTVRDNATGEGWTLYSDDLWYAIQEQIHGNVEDDDEG